MKEVSKEIYYDLSKNSIPVKELEQLQYPISRRILLFMPYSVSPARYGVRLIKDVRADSERLWYKEDLSFVTAKLLIADTHTKPFDTYCSSDLPSDSLWDWFCRWLI